MTSLVLVSKKEYIVERSINASVTAPLRNRIHEPVTSSHKMIDYRTKLLWYLADKKLQTWRNLPKRQENICEGFSGQEQGEDDPIHHPFDIIFGWFVPNGLVGCVGRIQYSKEQSDKTPYHDYESHSFFWPRPKRSSTQRRLPLMWDFTSNDEAGEDGFLRCLYSTKEWRQIK